jgi:hypothetical protein
VLVNGVAIGAVGVAVPRRITPEFPIDGIGRGCVSVGPMVVAVEVAPFEATTFNDRKRAVIAWISSGSSKLGTANSAMWESTAGQQ